jgi:hypothetical protein
MYLMGMALMSKYFIGMALIDMYLMDISHGHASHGRV